MNSYTRRFYDPLAQTVVGFRRPKDRHLIIGSVVFVCVVYGAVWWSEEKERRRKHTSIEKDIERERWRAQALGLAQPTDDGFAERYLEELGDDRLVKDHAEFHPENQTIR